MDLTFPFELTDEQRVELTYEVIELLTHRDDQNPDWQRELDVAFLGAIFDHDAEQPFFLGPDGSRYFGLKLPDDEAQITPTSLDREISELVRWGSGVVLLNPDGSPAYVYSPGDIVSLMLWKTSHVRWFGGWGEDADIDAYMAGGQVTFSAPNAEFVPPLVARCVDYYLSRFMLSQADLAKRPPSIVMIRHESHNKPEDASDLVLNVFFGDFPDDGPMTYEAFTEWVGYLFPRHLRKRIIMMDDENVAVDGFVTLKSVYEDAGLEAIPEPVREVSS